jgi:hypothetical protein
VGRGWGGVRAQLRRGLSGRLAPDRGGVDGPPPTRLHPQAAARAAQPPPRPAARLTARAAEWYHQWHSGSAACSRTPDPRSAAAAAPSTRSAWRASMAAYHWAKNRPYSVPQLPWW